MKKRPQDEDTICAPATPPGEGALTLIRVSGKNTFKIVRAVCPFLPVKIRSHRIYFGTLQHPKHGRDLDEVLVFCFEKGRSFTGEESVEISCHGGSFICSAVLEALIIAGARPAGRGEFSYRAFMNGKMDLVQAEHVLTLIESRSPKAHAQALRGLKGALSTRLKSMEQTLLKLLSHIEASIDFSDQEIAPLSLSRQKTLLQKIIREAEHWLKGFERGRINREGFSVILLGAPNAGKSSLFNYLVEEERAIVTPLPGTTTDMLTARMLWNEREFCIKDTAGLRQNPNPVEKMGMEKAQKAQALSDMNLFLVESAGTVKKEQFFGLNKGDPKKTVMVFSKADKLKPNQRKIFLKKVIKFVDSSVVAKKKLWLSARTGEGVEELKNLIYQKSDRGAGEIFLSTLRQKQAVEKIKSFLNRALKLLQKEESPEFIAFELQFALMVLYGLLGREYREDVIKNIFKEFCIGK